jgi:RNA polymerase sigma-70 factor (sigma-E family)
VHGIGAPRSDVSAEVQFERFALDAAPALLRAAYLLTGDRADAEDVLQSALWRVYRRWGAIRAAPEAYAHRVLVNLVRDRRRNAKRRPFEVVGDALSYAAVDDRSAEVLERGWMSELVGRLPRRQRDVIVLRFFLDLSVSETAAALGTREGTVKAYTARALLRMRELIADDNPMTDPRPDEVPDDFR